MPYLREAQFLVEEGATVEDVNQALYDFGMAMGPLAMSDLAGLDVGWRIRKEFNHLEKPGVRVPLVADQLCEMGRFGQKTGRGWSQYDENRQPSPDPETAALIEQHRARGGHRAARTSRRRRFVDRCLFALVNEGAQLLGEGIALRAADIDIVYLNGYGFPAWRGGPMFYADTVGLDRVLARGGVPRAPRHRICGARRRSCAPGRKRQDIFEFRSGGSRGGRRVSRRQLIQTVDISLGAGFDDIGGSAAPHYFAASVLQLHGDLAHGFGAAGDRANLVALELGGGLRDLRDRPANRVHRPVADGRAFPHVALHHAAGQSPSESPKCRCRCAGTAVQ